MSDKDQHARESECYARHNRSNQLGLEAKEIALGARRVAEANARRLAAIAGEDGKNGKLGDLRDDVAALRDSTRNLETTMTKQTTRLQIYTSLAAALFAVVGSALVTYLMK